MFDAYSDEHDDLGVASLSSSFSGSEAYISSSYDVFEPEEAALASSSPNTSSVSVEQESATHVGYEEQITIPESPPLLEKESDIESDIPSVRGTDEEYSDVSLEIPTLETEWDKIEDAQASRNETELNEVYSEGELIIPTLGAFLDAEIVDVQPENLATSKADEDYLEQELQLPALEKEWGTLADNQLGASDELELKELLNEEELNVPTLEALFDMEPVDAQLNATAVLEGGKAYTDDVPENQQPPDIGTVDIGVSYFHDDPIREYQDEIATESFKSAENEDIRLNASLDNSDSNLRDFEENEQASNLPDRWVPPGQFKDYESISDAYDTIHQDLQKQNGLLAQVQFFQAAGDVTGWLQLGGLESLNNIREVSQMVSDVDVSDNLLEYMRSLSTHLYNEINLPHAQSLLQAQDSLPSPANDGTMFSSALEHDLRMVEVEQATVEAHLKAAIESGVISQQDVEQINYLINVDINPFDDRDDWPKDVVGRELNILNLEDREALGKAMIFELHGKSKADYLDYMESQK